MDLVLTNSNLAIKSSKLQSKWTNVSISQPLTTGGSGWGGITYEVATDGTTRHSGTLDDGYNGVDYMCLEDGVHELKIADTDNTISWEFDDMTGAFKGGRGERKRWAGEMA